ncbi:MAG: helix-turn-helix domain-containing protein [Leptolyngbyaceae cyanobacterium bins.302]|nr:helix-turn-helix domain-containing protein [Leptolyngbyaceae cyanobacterium bins.302]
MTSATHYRLTCEEWLAVSQSLKMAELRVLYYLRTLDPFGDRPLDLKVVDIATATGLTKGTVSKALRTLDCQGYIDLELVAVRVQLKSIKKFPTGFLVSSRKPESSVGNLAMS